MLWCRHSFKDADAVVRHVFECNRLSNGWYWCPYCKRPERFLECDKGCDFVPKPRLHKRNKKQLALAFLKWLGPIPSLKKARADVGCADTSKDVKDAEDWSNEEEPDAGVSRSELPSPQRSNVRSLYELFSPTVSDAPEMGSNSIKFGVLDPKVLMSSPPIDSLDASASNDLELSSNNPIYSKTELRDRASFKTSYDHTVTSSATSHTLQAISTYGKNRPDAEILGKSSIRDSALLDDQSARNPLNDRYEEITDIRSNTPPPEYSFHAPQTASPSILSSSPMSPLSSALSLDSPVSAFIRPMLNVDHLTSGTRIAPEINSVPNFEGVGAWASLIPAREPPKSEETHSQGRIARLGASIPLSSDPIESYSSSQRRQSHFSLDKYGAEASHNDGPYLGGLPTQRRIQIEQLQGVVCIVKEKWLEGLLPCRDLHKRCSSLSASAIFTCGISTLEKWFCGTLEMTFDEVYSVMHIAIAATFLLHRDDESYRWDTFFRDAIQLQHAIVDKEEKLLFRKAVDLWPWLPDQQSTYFSVLIP